MAAGPMQGPAGVASGVSRTSVCVQQTKEHTAGESGCLGMAEVQIRLRGTEAGPDMQAEGGPNPEDRVGLP